MRAEWVATCVLFMERDIDFQSMQGALKSPISHILASIVVSWSFCNERFNGFIAGHQYVVGVGYFLSPHIPSGMQD